MGINEVAGTETATIELGGKKYTMSALTLNEFASMENDIKESKRKELVTVTEGIMVDPIQRVEYLRTELAKIDIVTVMKSPSKESLVSMVYHSIKRLHPDVKQEEIAEHMTLGKLTEMADNISVIMGTSSKKAKGRTKAPKK